MLRLDDVFDSQPSDPAAGWFINFLTKFRIETSKLIKGAGFAFIANTDHAAMKSSQMPLSISAKTAATLDGERQFSWQWGSRLLSPPLSMPVRKNSTPKHRGAPRSKGDSPLDSSKRKSAMAMNPTPATQQALDVTECRQRHALCRRYPSNDYLIIISATQCQTTMAIQSSSSMDGLVGPQTC